MADQTINIPQLLLILVVSGFAIRYFFFSGSSTTHQQHPPGTGARGGRDNRAREADVERIQVMFPQVARRSIMWDLQRNGGNVVATTERILSGRGLENPPQSFQPPMPVPAPSTASSSAAVQPKPSQPDLITRYNLSARVAEEKLGSEVEVKETEVKQGQAWSQNKGERQALLQRRREEMILKARRKMEEKVRAEASLGGGGGN